MSDLSLFLNPIDPTTYSRVDHPSDNGIKSFEQGGQLPDYDEYDVAIVGIKDIRTGISESALTDSSDAIRKALSKLYLRPGKRIADLGDVLPGNTLQDTYYALESIVQVLQQERKIVIFLGGGQNMTYGYYLGYKESDRLINLACVDYRFDLGKETGETIHNGNYLNNILLHSPNFLFNFINIGYQKYYVPRAHEELMDKLYFDVLRLGEIRTNIKKVEPALRSVDILSLDLSAVQTGHAPGTIFKNPNGLLPDEFCQITRYAGLSERVSTIGFHDYEQTNDEHGATAKLIAQSIWYFIDGLNARQNELVLSNTEDHTKYRVAVDGIENELVFYKSKSTEKWWVFVPQSGTESNQFRRHQMVPCDYEDYQKACKNHIPDVWMNTYRKFM